MNGKDMRRIVQDLASCTVILDRSSTTCCNCRTVSAGSTDVCDHCGATWQIVLIRDASRAELDDTAKLLARTVPHLMLLGAVSQRGFTKDGELELVQLYYTGDWRERLVADSVMNPRC